MVPFRWKVLDDFPIRQFYKKIIPKGILDRFQAVFRQKFSVFYGYAKDKISASLSTSAEKLSNFASFLKSKLPEGALEKVKNKSGGAFGKLKNLSTKI